MKFNLKNTILLGLKITITSLFSVVHQYHSYISDIKPHLGVYIVNLNNFFPNPTFEIQLFSPVYKVRKAPPPPRICLEFITQKIIQFSSFPFFLSFPQLPIPPPS